MASKGSHPDGLSTSGEPAKVSRVAKERKHAKGLKSANSAAHYSLQQPQQPPVAGVTDSTTLLHQAQ